MHEIICPHCSKAFKIDEAGYADILKQVRNSEFDKELHKRLELAEQDKNNAVEIAQAKAGSEMQQATAAKDAEIQKLKAELKAGDMARQLAVAEALKTVEKERDALANNVKQLKLEKQLSEQSLKEKYETQVKDRDDAIERLKDMKARLSTKMVGETLEQHCEIEFNRILGPQLSRVLTLKKTTMQNLAAREIIYSETRTRPILKLFQLCLK